MSAHILSENLPDWQNGVSVVVPTFRRPEGIKIALNSLITQDVGARTIEIIVADNDPDAGARDTVAAIAEKSEMEIVYVHVPNPGVSNARNGALEHARGRYIVFLDDDMEALPGWVDSLIKTSNTFKSGIVFGPAIAQMPNADDPRNPYLEPYFSRIADTDKEGPIQETLGTGGCLLDMRLCDMPSPPFDTSLNEVGGEDDLLFDHLRRRGTKVAWSPKAEAYEHVPAKRATDSYIWKRNFAFGQGPVHIHKSRGWRGAPQGIRFMITGSMQFFVFAPVWWVLRGLGQPSYVKYMALAARGLGKVLWWDGLSPKLYGQAMIDQAAKTAPNSPS